MAADREAPLDLDGLELLGMSAHLIGRDDVAVQAGMRGFALGGNRANSSALPGPASGSGWILRSAARLLRPVRGSVARPSLIEKSGRECVEAGYLLIPMGIAQLEGQHEPDGGVRDVPADLRDRRSVRRRRPRGDRADGTRRGADRAR